MARFSTPRAAVRAAVRDVVYPITGAGGIDPAALTGLIAGYRVSDTVRTGSEVDEWTDITGNGYDATPVSTKDTVVSHADGDYAAGGQRYAPASPIPVDFEAATIVVVFRSGRRQAGNAIGQSTVALTNPAASGGGVLTDSGAAQFYNAVRRGGCVRNPSGHTNVLAMRWGASACTFRSNGISDDVAANRAATTEEFVHIWGYAGAGSFRWGQERQELYFFDRALTDAELAGIEAYYACRRPTTALHIVGDSFVNGTGASSGGNAYARVLESSTGLSVCVHGGSGYRFSNLTSANLVASIASSSGAGLSPIVVLDLGKNDLASGVADATLRTTWTSFASAITAAGGQLVAVTIPPRTAGFSGGADASSYETNRNSFNVWIRTQTANFDAVADVANNANLGDVADVSGSYYSGDGIHLSDLGHAEWASVIKGAIDSI